MFMDWLRQYRPDLVPRYEELYGERAYLPQAERKRLAALARGPIRLSRFITQPRPSDRTNAAAEPGGTGRRRSDQGGSAQPRQAQPRLF